MKILHIVSSYWPAFEFGGPIESVHQLNKWLIKKGADITVYTTNAGLKKNKRSIIFTWARKEYRNLLLARKAGVNVPTPYAVNGNVLVMEMIGSSEPALRLKSDIPDDLKKFYETFIKDLKNLKNFCS